MIYQYSQILQKIEYIFNLIIADDFHLEYIAKTNMIYKKTTRLLFLVDVQHVDYSLEGSVVDDIIK